MAAALDDYIKADNVDTSVYLDSDMEMNASWTASPISCPTTTLHVPALPHDIWSDADLQGGLCRRKRRRRA